MGNLNYIVFGGVDSRDYGIYISGEGVFNAPERDVEVVNIPGKDGDLLIDRGRFLNIEVTYPGFNFEPDLSTFAERLRAFRAALASQIGYQRLEDSFHPDEFRLASFRSGLDINPVMYNTASTFDIAFDCKPQRFLKSGEEEIDPSEWGETETKTGEIVSFEAESNTGIKSLVVGIEPNQSGSGDPSPDNVRPISGWDEVEVNHSGKNILKLPTWEEVTALPRVGNYSSMAIKCKPNTDYYLSSRVINDYVPSGLYIYVLITNNPNAESPFLSIVHHYDGIRNGVIRSTTDGYLWLRISQTIESKWNRILESIETQLEEGTTPTSYQPFGQSHSITLPSTVYGGTLDLISGVLTVTKAYVDLGTLNYEYMSSGYFRASLSPSPVIDNSRTSSLSSCYKAYKGYDFGSLVGSGNKGFSITNYSSASYPLLVVDSAYTSASAFKTAMSGKQLVYELATPQTYQLTSEQIETILGVNNIWADTGDVSVEIGEDPNILVNPTPFEALPIFEVVGTGSLTVGNTTINITGDLTQDIFIDSDIMEAYEDDNGAIISRNDRINLSGTDFPKLGEETRVESNGLTSVKITPRWWTI